MRCPNIMIMAFNVEPDEISQNLIGFCSVYYLNDAGRLVIQIRQ